MSHDEFTKLFKYLEKRFSDMDKRFDEHDKRFDYLTGIVAELVIDVRDIKRDLHDLHQSDARQNRWIHELAYKTKTKLSYE